MAKPKHVGTWVIGILDGEITKWGIDGDTEFPFKTDGEAVKQAQWLASHPLHKDDLLYIVRVFDNGQMVQYYFDPKESV
jgi:hypothetical protein